jgi:hypothetical protein
MHDILHLGVRLFWLYAIVVFVLGILGTKLYVRWFPSRNIDQRSGRQIVGTLLFAFVGIIASVVAIALLLFAVPASLPGLIAALCFSIAVVFGTSEEKI